MLRKTTAAQIRERMKYNMRIAQEAERQYTILADQYMNGNIHEPIGKQQAKLQSIRDKALREIERCGRKLAKMQK